MTRKHEMLALALIAIAIVMTIGFTMRVSDDSHQARVGKQQCERLAKVMKVTDWHYAKEGRECVVHVDGKIHAFKM